MSFNPRSPNSSASSPRPDSWCPDHAPLTRHHARPRNELATNVILRLLPRTQETQVLEAIIAVHLKAYDFDWEQVDSLNLTETQVPRLFHYSRKYALTFDVEDPDGYFLVFRPGINQEESTELVLGGWLRVIPHVQAWAGRVKEAVDAENLTG